MDRTRDDRKEDELIQLIMEERSQKMSNGILKYFIIFASLVLKRFGGQVNLVGSRAGPSSTNSSDVDLMFCPHPTLKEKMFLYNTQCPCFFQVSSDDIGKDLEAYISENGEYLSGKSLKNVPSEIFKFISVFFRMCRELGVSKVGYIHFQTTDTNSSEGSIFDSLGPSIDLVPAFKISSCPDSVKVWARRERQWPDATVVDSILTCEFHAVAKVSPLNGDSEKDFCLSFIVAENKLVGSLTERQLTCFRILKFLKPSLQNIVLVTHSRNTITTHCSVQMQLSNEDLTRPISECNIITSYHLKTAFLWVCEKKQTSFWECKNVKECVCEVLRYLFSCLDGGYLPHYFLPAMNLFSGISSEDLSLASKDVELFLNSSVDILEVALYCVNTEPALESGDIPEIVGKPQGGLREALQIMLHHLFDNTESEVSKAEMDSRFSLLRGLFEECVYPSMVEHIDKKFPEQRSTSNLPSLCTDDSKLIAFPTDTTTNELPVRDSCNSELQPQTGDLGAFLFECTFWSCIADFNYSLFSNHYSVKPVHTVKCLKSFFKLIDMSHQFKESGNAELDYFYAIAHAFSRLSEANALAERSKVTGVSDDDKESGKNQDPMEIMQMASRFLQIAVSREHGKNPNDQYIEGIHHISGMLSNFFDSKVQNQSKDREKVYQDDGKNIKDESTILPNICKTLQEKLNNNGDNHEFNEFVNGICDGFSALFQSKGFSWSGLDECGISPEGRVNPNSSSENLTIVSTKMDSKSRNKKLHEKLEMDIELD